MLKRYIPIALAAATFVVFSGWAQAQSDNMAHRLNRLENEIQTLSQAMFRNQGQSYADTGSAAVPVASGNMAADLEVRLSQLEVEVRKMTGEIERANYNVRQVQEKLDRVLSDYEMRLSDIEVKMHGADQVGEASPTGQQYRGVTSASAPSKLQVVDQETVPYPGIQNERERRPGAVKSLGTLRQTPEGEMVDAPALAQDVSANPTALYEQSFANLRSRNYDDAEKGFRSFMQSYPTHPLFSNAQYWLGESHYVRGNYEQSARLFAEGYQRDPSGPKAADNLLKLGLALSNLGKTSDACLTFMQLQKSFAKAGSQSILHRAEQEMNRLKCNS